MKQLVSKYNIPTPRYTSYPTVPYWDKKPLSRKSWFQSVINTFSEDQAISLYIHLPYCENLCTYCACNTRITKNHSVEKPYIDSVLSEWKLYTKLFRKKPVIRELHLGGGTPTFFSPDNLERLMNGILHHSVLATNHEFSFEAHPNNTTFEHLATLYDWGFRRLSIGVQDFSDEILRVINRKQTAHEVERVTYEARALGYESVNYDIIYGLPLQTPSDILRNARKISELRPDRIAFYSYAHVPWIKPGQRAYAETDLPKGPAKRKLYELGKALFGANGYTEIGLDHFALKADGLFKAQQNQTLHRNFMGYTDKYTRLLIGLGASAISDTWGAYIQNEKTVEAYRSSVAQEEIPFFRGHLLTPEDKIIRQHILNLMCKMETTWKDNSLQSEAVYAALEHLYPLEKDGLVEIKPYQLKIKKAGKPFIRNICMAFDARYWKNQPEGQLFSQTA